LAIHQWVCITADGKRKRGHEKNSCSEGPDAKRVAAAFPDAEQHFLKAELVLRLDKAITSLGLTQRAAARRIGATQPELSKILGGKFTEVSLERLMRFLTALSCHIEIKIGAEQENKAGDVTIKDVRRTAA
jgi:predicted XRE-type DNA-binding protein